MSSLSSREDESSFGAIWDFYIWALGPLSPSVGQSLSWRGNIGAFQSVKILDLVQDIKRHRSFTENSSTFQRYKWRGWRKKTKTGRDKGGDLQLHPHSEFRGSQSRIGKKNSQGSGEVASGFCLLLGVVTLNDRSLENTRGPSPVSNTELAKASPSTCVQESLPGNLGSGFPFTQNPGALPWMRAGGANPDPIQLWASLGWLLDSVPAVQPAIECQQPQSSGFGDISVHSSV